MTLRLWSWPMKCQRNAPGYAVGLRLQLLGAVLADERDAGLGERPQLLQRHVLDRREDLDAVRQLGADAREVLAHAAGVDAGDQARHTTPAWRPVTPPSRRWEKNRPNQHIVHRPMSCTVGNARFRRARCGGRPRGRGCARRGGVVAGERRVDLLADLVAAAAGAGADQRGHRAVAAALAQRRDALGDDAGGRAAPAGVQRRDGAVAASSTGVQSAANTSAGWPVSAVAWPSSSAGGRAGPGGSVARRTVAPWTWRAVQEALARAAGGGGHAGAVLVDVGAVVGGQPAEVERGERPGRRRRRGGW